MLPYSLITYLIDSSAAVSLLRELGARLAPTGRIVLDAFIPQPVTSFTELRREAAAITHAARRRPREDGGPISWIQQQLPANGTPVIAASDYVSAVADLIRPWIADPYTTLGTDGFGRSDTRAALRRFFEVDRHWIAVAALHALGDARTPDAMKRYGLNPDASPPSAR